jgi:hypothetical protein
VGRVLGQPLADPRRYLGRVGALIEGPGSTPASRASTTCACSRPRPASKPSRSRGCSSAWDSLHVAATPERRSGEVEPVQTDPFPVREPVHEGSVGGRARDHRVECVLDRSERQICFPRRCRCDWK